MDVSIRVEMDKLLNSYNGGGVEGVSADYVSILNCIRDEKFVSNCIKIVECKNLELKVKYTIVY